MINSFNDFLNETYSNGNIMYTTEVILPKLATPISNKLLNSNILKELEKKGGNTGKIWIYNSKSIFVKSYDDDNYIVANFID